MPPVCCDTSFLFALYGNDVHTRRALAMVGNLSQPLTLSAFNELELENALRFAAWRRLFTVEQLRQSLAAYLADRNKACLVVAPCNLAQVITEARHLSTLYTQKAGYRSFDILHVAAALQLGALRFFSFDERQRKLALAAGLKPGF